MLLINSHYKYASPAGYTQELEKVDFGSCALNKPIHSTYKDYSCPLIDTVGITPWFKSGSWH